MNILSLALLIAALVLAVLAAFGIEYPKVGFIALSLACFYASQLVPRLG